MRSGLGLLFILLAVLAASLWFLLRNNGGDALIEGIGKGIQALTR